MRLQACPTSPYTPSATSTTSVLTRRATTATTRQCPADSSDTRVELSSGAPSNDSNNMAFWAQSTHYIRKLQMHLIDGRRSPDERRPFSLPAVIKCCRRQLVFTSSTGKFSLLSCPPMWTGFHHVGVWATLNSMTWHQPATNDRNRLCKSRYLVVRALLPLTTRCGLWCWGWGDM